MKIISENQKKSAETFAEAFLAAGMLLFLGWEHSLEN